MSRLRSPRRTSLVPEVPLPHPVRWFVVAVVLAGAAGTALYEATTARPFVTIPGITAEENGAALDVVAAVLAVVVVLAVRRFLYDRLAWRPGPVEIMSFTGDPEATGVRTEEVRAEFREALTGMSLYSPDLLPNAPATDSILDDVRIAFDKQHNAVSAAVLVLTSVIRIRYAYQVSVQLMARDADGRCGLSLYVSRMPGGPGEVRTIRAPTWPGVARRAAHAVGAYVVPRSRLSRRSPWRAWHGLDMPYELFHHNQVASEYIRRRRYEEALPVLYETLNDDPQNPYLRIQLAQVQEQLGLFIDATVTYADVVAIESWHDRRLWSRLRRLVADDATDGPPPGPHRDPNGRDALLIARYRLVCRLAAAEQLAEQWLRTSPGRKPRNELREEERIALRDRLRGWLRPYVMAYRTEYPGTVFTIERAGLPELRHFLQYVARRETDSLIDDYRWSRGRRRPGMIMSQTGLNLMRVWSDLYLSLATYVLDQRPGGGGWAPDPALLERRITRYLALQPGRARGWREYYNAACTMAVALNEERDPGRRAGFALRAVRHLERAVSSTDSGFVGRHARWLSIGDPDLNPLRATPEFVGFADRYLPSPESRILRPNDLLLPLVMSFHTLRLLESFAERRAAELRDRASRRTPMTAADREREGEARKAAAEYAHDDRHWQTRAELIGLASTTPGLPRLRADLPQFHEDPAVRALAERRTAAGADRGYPDDLTEYDELMRYFNDVIKRREAAWREIETWIGANRPSVRDAVEFWNGLAAEIRAALEQKEPDPRPGTGDPHPVSPG